MTNNLKLQYKSESYSGNLAFLIIWLFMMGCFVAIVFIVKATDLSPWISFIFAILVFGFPLIFIKKIKALFTSKVLLKMDKDSFSVSYLDSDNERVKKQRVYPWESIQGYSFYFGESSPTITSLTLHFKKGLPKSFDFFDKEFKDTKSFNEMLNNDCLLTLFYKQVKQYNIYKTKEEQIQQLAGFFASKIGTVIIYLLTALIVASIVLHLVIDPKSSFATLLISIGLVAGFFSKRKGSLELYKKIKELDNK